MSAPTHSAQELLESWGDVVPTFDSDLYDSPTSLTGLLARYQRPATTLYDRADGRYLPVYQTEFDLAVIRSMGRTLAVAAPGLVGGLRNMCNYTIGEGFSFTATRETNADLTEKQCEPLLKLIQTEIAKFLDDNSFLSGFDREIHDTSIIDGESFLYLQPVDDRVRVSRCEPDQVREPAGARELEDWIQGAYGIECDSFVSSWSFGVHTRADALDDPLGYHVVADESGVNWEYVPADRMVHIKRNVTRNAKRGFSDLYPIEADSARGEKLRRNMAEGAAIQSAIAFVRQHVAGATRAGVETMLGENKSATQYPTTFNGLGRPKNIVQYRPGTVVDLSAGLEYKPGPLGSERANDFLLVASYVQRMQAVRWSMPEYMFSGDASNANYASTMEATAPFVKSCEAEQRFYSRHFVALIWKALKLRWELGAFDRFDYEWERIEQSIKITADCPEVATRDELANVQRQEILIRLGILSRKTAAAQNGLDYEAEAANGAKPEGQGGEQQAAEGPGDSATNGAAPGDAPEGSLPQPLGETELFECGGKGGKPGRCPRHLSRLKSRKIRDGKSKDPVLPSRVDRSKGVASGSGHSALTAAQSQIGKPNRSPNSQIAPAKSNQRTTDSRQSSRAAQQRSVTGETTKAKKVSTSSNSSETTKTTTPPVPLAKAPTAGKIRTPSTVAAGTPEPARRKKDASPATHAPVQPVTPKQKEKINRQKPAIKERQDYAKRDMNEAATAMGSIVTPGNGPSDHFISGIRRGKLIILPLEHKTLLDRVRNSVAISGSALHTKARMSVDTGFSFGLTVSDRRADRAGGKDTPIKKRELLVQLGASSRGLNKLVRFKNWRTAKAALLDAAAGIRSKRAAGLHTDYKWNSSITKAKADRSLGVPKHPNAIKAMNAAVQKMRAVQAKHSRKRRK